MRVRGRGKVRVVEDDDPKNLQGTIALPHGAAAVIHKAVMSGLGISDHNDDETGRHRLFGRLTGTFQGLDTKTAPDQGE